MAAAVAFNFSDQRVSVKWNDFAVLRFIVINRNTRLMDFLIIKLLRFIFGQSVDGRGAAFRDQTDEESQSLGIGQRR